MAATSAGNASCLAAKGLDISLAALQRQDPYINNIVDVASQVALYTYNNRKNEWEKTEVEGTLFIYTRLASPRHGFTIMNRLSIENLTEPITKDLDFQLQDPFLLYRNARLVIHGIWFYDKEDCQRIAQRMKILTQQEQFLAQSQGGWLSPAAAAGGGRLEGVVGGRESKGVDIIQMLTKARTEYDKKSTSEPKEIGGSSVLSGNPNLIKPIPVKPNTQDGDGAEPKSLPLAVLFGSQHQHHSSPQSAPAPAVVTATKGKKDRPPVARTLTYDDKPNPGRIVSTNGGNAAAPVAGSGGGIRVLKRDDGGKVGAALLPSPTAAQQQQHCPAIAKLMQGQRGAEGGLHTVSESPEKRLCDNGVPLEHHRLYQHQPQQHRHVEEESVPCDPIKKLLQRHLPQPHPATVSFSPPAATACPNPPPHPPHVSCQPVVADSGSFSQFQQQKHQQMIVSLSKCQHGNVAAAQGAGLQPQMPGMLSPHELLQRLQLVQQEQSLASQEPPRLCPTLAPRFIGPVPNQVPGPNPSTPGQKAALKLKVISPQRIPATVAPTLLLSPNMFIQTSPNARFPAVESCPAHSVLLRPSQQEEHRVLSRNQMQATLLHLIQTDGSFLDSIYEAYVSRCANSSSSK